MRGSFLKKKNMQQDGVSATIYQQPVREFQRLHTNSRHGHERDRNCHNRTIILRLPASHSHRHGQPGR